MIEAGRHSWVAPALDWYNRRLLRRSFARIRVNGLANLKSDRPLIAAPNHSCWWDGCVDLYLTRQVVRMESFLMMGERELSRHRIFSALGVFSVPEHDSRQQRARSARYALGLLSRSGPRVIWIYPQGEMLPARMPLELRDGVAVLAAGANVPVVPVAHRYEFVRDDHPEVLVRIGSPIRLSGGRSADRARLAEAIETELRQIDEDLIAQNFSGYETVLEGKRSRNERLQRLGVGPLAR